MYKRFDVLYSEVLRNHYIVIQFDPEHKNYILQEYSQIKKIFTSDLVYMTQIEMYNKHFHINGESKIRKKIKEMASICDLDDITHDWYGDNGWSYPYYDMDKVEKLLLESHWLKPLKKSFEDNPVIKQNQTSQVFWTMEQWFDWNWNLEISIMSIPSNETKTENEETSNEHNYKINH